MDIGDRIAAYRAQHGMTQNGFARSAQVPSYTIFCLEHKKRSEITATTACKIARFMDISVEELIGFESIETLSEEAGMAG